MEMEMRKITQNIIARRAYHPLFFKHFRGIIVTKIVKRSLNTFSLLDNANFEH